MKFVVHCKRAPYDVYIGRPSVWGNPFSHQHGTKAQYRVATRDEAVAAYEKWIRSLPELIKLARQELKGKVLACWCAPQACHGDVLARIANNICEACLGTKYNACCEECPVCDGTGEQPMSRQDMIETLYGRRQ